MGRRSLQGIALCSFLTLGCGVLHAADDKASAPADYPAAIAAPAVPRDMAAIDNDIQTESATLRGVFSTPDVLTDPVKRKAAAPQAVPVLKRLIALFNELNAGPSEQGKMIAQHALPQFQTFLAVFDNDTLAQLEKWSKGSDQAKALDAKDSLLLVHWIKSAADASAQAQVVSEAKSLARDNPASDKVTSTLLTMADFTTAAPGMADKLKDSVIEMTSPSAQEIRTKLVHERTLKSMRDKPLTIEGAMLDGTKVSTANWKGKVVFVEFWATWCPTCRAELPRVKQAYADYHAKGLEILGVSCDDAGADLKKFLDENKDMPWPQIYDVKNPGWSPLATSFGIDAIPTMLLIDKKGVVRSVNAQEDFEQLIPKLLAEKD